MIKLNKNNSLIHLFLIFSLFLVGGCNKEESSAPPAPTPPVAAKNVPPPIQKQQSSAIAPIITSPGLDFTSRKDPFKAFIVAPEKPVGNVRSAELLPIQSYELSKFKVAGIIVGLKENRALVIDPAGKGYVVKKGMLIGDSDGQITDITATSIVVQEKFRDDNGHIKSRTVQLTLPKKK